jgi:hypothetical protein
MVLLFVSLSFFFVGKTTIVVAVRVASAVIPSGLVYMAYTNHIMGVPQRKYASRSRLLGLEPYILGFHVAWVSSPL